MERQLNSTEPQTSVTEELARLREENEQLKSSLQRMAGLAYRDPLTGLRNRRYFDERLEEEMARLRRVGSLSLSLMVIDLDGFKHVNDTFGHAAGDRVLIWVAEFLRAHVRFSDPCCRFGGDEFVLLLPDTTAEGCATLAQNLSTQLDACRTRGEAAVGFSIGCATSRRPDSPGELIARADASMYEDKRARHAVIPLRPRASFAA